jgi:hypothetical protein
VRPETYTYFWAHFKKNNKKSRNTKLGTEEDIYLESFQGFWKGPTQLWFSES